jgi:ubiquinone/menaquinone biosynthesis C-methylase UbiE
MSETTGSLGGERYSQIGNRAFVEQIAKRTVSHDADFLLPHLEPGMRLLDIGCGPGSITLGLAQVVAPGETIGLDIQESSIELARQAASDTGITNVRFEVGDCYKLPFEDGSFDVCYANALLQHLSEPVAALAEMRRVLRPGGFAGVRDLNSPNIRVPEDPLFDLATSLVSRVREANGGQMLAARHHREWLVAAGFARTYASASCESFGSLTETRSHADLLRGTYLGVLRAAVDLGFIDQEKADEILAATVAWGERPDAFAVRVRCNAIGWTD